MAVDKSRWEACERCGELIPVHRDCGLRDGHAVVELGTCTYVCPHCGFGHVGTPETWLDLPTQETCHECAAVLDGAEACPRCGFPRGWSRVSCPRCRHRQPVYTPHWVVQCNFYTLDCVRCETRHVSLCIC